MKRKKMTVFIALGVFGLLLIFVAARQDGLARRGILINGGHTLEWAGSAYMGMELKYEFYYHGERIEADNSIEKIRGLREFENKYFPVIYDPKLGQSELLIEPEEFRNYNIPFPDSLSWVIKYFK